MKISVKAFNDDLILFRQWNALFEQALPGGWGINRDWLPPNGSYPSIEQNGPQDETTLLSTFPGTSPVDPHSFGHTWAGWMRGSEAFYHGYVEACCKEYEYVTDGNIAMAGFQSLLLRTLKIYITQEGWSQKDIEIVGQEIEKL